jgi:hypothetical protein
LSQTIKGTVGTQALPGKTTECLGLLQRSRSEGGARPCSSEGAAGAFNSAKRSHGWGRGKEGEMTQTLYAHMNKRKNLKKLLKKKGHGMLPRHDPRCATIKPKQQIVPWLWAQVPKTWGHPRSLSPS